MAVPPFTEQHPGEALPAAISEWSTLFLLKVGGTTRRKFSSCKGHAWSRSRSFFLRVVHFQLSQSPWCSGCGGAGDALPASLWALLGKIPHLALAVGSGWGFICCWEDLNWETAGSSMGLATVSCEFVQLFAIQVCTGTRDQSLEVGNGMV